MAYFAKVIDNKVVNVIAAEQDFIDSYDDGINEGEWIQTSYNTKGGKHYSPETGLEDDKLPLRKNFAGFNYTYDGENDAFIAEVQATGWFESGDWDRDGPSRQENWTGIYYVDKRGVKVLTPVDFQTQWYYGKDFSFRGIEDINGDGELDLIIGNNSSVFYDYNTVTLILERYKDGFRSWGFGIFPSGGC